MSSKRALTLAYAVAIGCLSGFYCFVLYLVAHPNYTAEYRSFYIERIPDDWHPDRYQATPAEGMMFTTTALPTFVSWTHGFSYSDHSGRWTDADQGFPPAIGLVDKINKPVCIELKLRPSWPEEQQTVSVSFGGEQQRFTLNSSEFSTYRLQFHVRQPADSLSFDFPVPPRIGDVQHTKDPRKLGLDFVSLRIIAPNCQAAQ